LIDRSAGLLYTRGDATLQEVGLMSAIAAATERTLGRLLPPWWLFLLIGIGWTLVALIVLRFDYTSVNAIAILFGIVAIAAGLLEIMVTVLASGWWKLLYGVLAVVFIATGIISFIHPGDTFLALAAVISFFLVFAGRFTASTTSGLRVLKRRSAPRIES
jgi:uncharacterized membrane protein HdeD (DUF308 family)